MLSDVLFMCVLSMGCGGMFPGREVWIYSCVSEWRALRGWVYRLEVDSVLFLSCFSIISLNFLLFLYFFFFLWGSSYLINFNCYKYQDVLCKNICSILVQLVNRSRVFWQVRWSNRRVFPDRCGSLMDGGCWYIWCSNSWQQRIIFTQYSCDEKWMEKKL